MHIHKVSEKDSKIITPPNLKEFNYEGNSYRVELDEPEEIRMSFYVRDIRVYKNNKLIKSISKSLDCSSYELTSNNDRFLSIPTSTGLEIIDLKKEKTKGFDIYFLIGNEFSENNKFCIINGQTESKLIDLESLSIKLKIKDLDNYISQSRFGFDNKMWTLEKWNNRFRIEIINPENLESQYSVIETPFDFFKIEKSDYENIINDQTHNLKIKKVGLLFSELLNKWQYVKSKDKIIYKTLIPISKTKYSNNYKRDYCEVEEKYIEFSENTSSYEKPMFDFWNKIKQSLKKSW